MQALTKIIERGTKEKYLELLRQAFRAVANLCFDHDENRERFVAAGGVKVLNEAMEMLKTISPEDSEEIRKAGGGLLLNAANGNTQVQKDLIEGGAVESLVWLINHSNEHGDTEMAMQAISILAEQADATKKMGGAVGPFVMKLATLNAEEDEEEVREVADILRRVAMTDEGLEGFAQNQIPTLLLHLARTRNDRVGQVAAVLLGTVLGHDGALAEVYGKEGDKLIELAVAMMQNPGENLDRAAAGALMVGNLGRTDERSTKLAQSPGVIEALLVLAQRDWTQHQHAALHCLKNLCKLPPNRERVMAQKEFLPAVIAGLNNSQEVLQYISASLFRICLMDQSPARIVELVTVDPGLLKRLCHLGNSEVMHVRAEASRALTNAIKFGQDPVLKQKVVDAGAIPVLASLIKAEHPMLKAEGLLALTLLASTASDYRKAIREADTLDAITDIVSKFPSPELRCNGLSLLSALYIDEGHGLDTAKVDKVISDLKTQGSIKPPVDQLVTQLEQILKV